MQVFSGTLPLLVWELKCSNSAGVIFTARKRSLGQGNIFRSVCQEFCPQGRGSTSAGTPPRDQAGTPHRTRYTPLTRQLHPQGPGRYTPLDQAVPPPPRAVHAGRYGQQGGGTHPTGVHSCCMS